MTLQKKSLRRLASELQMTRNDPVDEDFIAHHGILGMRWGVRRFQNKDGSLKPAGRKRYNNDDDERDKGLAPGVQNTSNKKSGLGKIAAIAGASALAGATAKATMDALGNNNKSYKNMTDEELMKANKRAALENKYKQNNDIHDSPADAMDSASKGIEAVRKYRNAGGPPQNSSQNRYNTRRTMTQKEMDSMSDQDLQRLVNRMNLETQYSRLTSDPQERSKVDVGLERAQAIMTIVGSAVTIGAAAYGASKKFGSKSPVSPTAFELASKK